MAKPNKLDYSASIVAIEQEKHWPEGQIIDWSLLSKNKLPKAYNWRGSLHVDGMQPEGLFVEMYYKSSVIPGVPDNINMGLFAENCLIVAIHENGPSRHMNGIGAGLPHYRMAVDHPHLHIPVKECSYGYCEPVERQSIDSLWRYFLNKANIIDAPDIKLPSGDQREFEL